MFKKDTLPWAGRGIGGALAPWIRRMMMANGGIDSISPRREIQRGCAC